MIIFFLAMLFIALLYLYFTKSVYKYWESKGVPYPEPTLFLGNVKEAVNLKSNIADICNDIYRKYSNYKYVGFYNLWTPALVVRDPELVKEITIKQFSSFRNNWVGTELETDSALYYNPFGLEYNEWRSIRPLLSPQFTSSKIRSTFPQTRKVCQKMAEYIRNEIRKSGVNTLESTELTLRFTGDNVMSCAYGLDGRSFEVKFPDCFKLGDQIANGTKMVQFKKMIGLFSPFLRRMLKITFVGNPTPKMFGDIILEAIKYRDQNNVTRNDYLDFLRELKSKSNGVTDEVLVGHALTFFLDGVDTGSLALSYALFELALNPNVQKTARTEIETVLEKHGGEFTYEALQEMDYVDNIVSETLRRHPIIKILNRVCTKDCRFPVPESFGAKDGEVVIGKGTHVFIPVQSIHNDPNNYSDPGKFDPDRFKGGNGRNCFFGFGEGPRICLGRRFAQQQIKAGLVSILSEFELRLNEKTELPLKVNNSLHLSDAPKDGIWIDFHQIV